MLRLLTFLTLLPTLILAEEDAAPIEDYDFVSEFIRMLSLLGIMIGVLLLLAWALKRIMNSRMEQMNESSNIRILERRALAPKSAVYLLEVEGTKMVVAESPAGIHHLTTIEQEPARSHELV
jgi:flagellar biosynthetic protein FliO